MEDQTNNTTPTETAPTEAAPDESIELDFVQEDDQVLEEQLEWLSDSIFDIITTTPSNNNPINNISTAPSRPGVHELGKDLERRLVRQAACNVLTSPSQLFGAMIVKDDCAFMSKDIKVSPHFYLGKIKKRKKALVSFTSNEYLEC